MYHQDSSHPNLDGTSQRYKIAINKHATESTKNFDKFLVTTATQTPLIRASGVLFRQVFR